MISQVIDLSNPKTFKQYGEKYNYSIMLYHGLFGVEVRKIPAELLQQQSKTNQENIFYHKDSLLLTGSIKEILDRTELFNLDKSIRNEIIKAIQNFEKSHVVNYRIGKRKFDFRFAHVMGILNVTPDSFSDGGRYNRKDQAVSYAIEMIESGADIVDIGGESTRPGSEPVNESEELGRVIPVIKEIINIKPEAILSIDTTKAKVAKEALNCGALIVNDISGGKFEPDIFNVAAEFDATMILMHIQGKPKTMQASPIYTNVVSEVYDYLSYQCSIASMHGIDKIIVDPGIGFGKITEDNLCLIERLEDFKSLGFPIMIGLSRKSFIGNILNLQVEDRDDATNAMNSFAMAKRARIIRTHNVKQAVQGCKLYNSLITN